MRSRNLISVISIAGNLQVDIEDTGHAKMAKTQKLPWELKATWFLFTCEGTIC